MNKKILIISPHFPPSNLAAVHRSRLFALHLPSFGWQPMILTVDEKYYEERPDHNLTELIPGFLHVEKVKALPITNPRVVGDIGLRAFFHLYKKAKKIIKEQDVDFLYIPIPSFYIALLGRWLHKTTKIPYGIDYIDPWVHSTSAGDRLFSRHWFSEKLAEWLEPIAVKKASIITGVAEGYYKGVIERNPHLSQQAHCGAMPYGAERSDHEMVKKIKIEPYLFPVKKDKVQLVYGGAMLPKAYAPLTAIMEAIQANPDNFQNLEIHFIGTGKIPTDSQSYNIKPLAEKYNIWQKNIFEYPARIPYLDVLVHLNSATGIFILGSTEKHYTPSKVFQAVLSEKPIFAVLHEESTALQVVNRTGAGICFPINENNMDALKMGFSQAYLQFLDFVKQYNPQKVKHEEFEFYSAYHVTKQLAKLLDRI